MIRLFLNPPCYTELNKEDHNDVSDDVESGSETGIKESPDTGHCHAGVT